MTVAAEQNISVCSQGERTDRECTQAVEMNTVGRSHSLAESK